MGHLSERGALAADEFAPVWSFFEALTARTAGRPDVCDFTFGNPHEMPLPGLVAALRTSVEPQREDWFAYKTNEAEPRAVIAGALGREIGLALRARGRGPDPGRLRGDRAGFPPGDGRRRRGDHPGAGLVLLRPDAARRRSRAGQGGARARALRPRPRGDRRGDHPPHPHGGGELAAQPHGADLSARGRCRRSPTCSRPPRGGSARASGSSRTSPTGASASTATASPARRRSIPGR